MPFADVNGQHVYFQDSGGDGAAVIFSHGFLMDHEMFDPQVEAISGEFRCITWDERGSGRPMRQARLAIGTRPTTPSPCCRIWACRRRSSSECRRAASCRCGPP